MNLTCDTELTERGVEVTHATLGKVATIERKLEAWGEHKQHPAGWFVFPYVFPPYERGATFQSYQAAEFYALALAYEMVALGWPKKPTVA